jgi:site-specific DNA-cytosine methylase
MRTVLAIECDAWAAATYRANMPGVEVWERDIRACVADLAPGLADVVLGGPPCQPFSLSGSRKGSADARDCTPEFVEAVRRVRPRQFLMENVPGLLSWEGGRHAARIRADLERAGYVVDVRVLDAVYFGVPQFRERVWFWGIRSDLCNAGVRHAWPRPTHRAPSRQPGFFDAEELLPWVTVGEALELSGARIAGAGTNPHYPGDRRTERDITDEPSTCIQAATGASGNALPRVIGGGAHGDIPSKDRQKRDITDEPSVTVTATFGEGGDTPRVATLTQERAVPRVVSAKHPACEVDRPAVTVSTAGDGHSARETLVRIPGASGWSGQRRRRGARPAPAVTSRSNPELVRANWSEASHARRDAAHPEAPAPTVADYGRPGSVGALAVDEVMVSQGDTITVGHGEPVAHAKRQGYYRRLTPDECLRLQSAPVDWIWPEGITKTARYRVAGNGWACLMAWHLRRALERVDPESQTVLDLFAGGGLGAVGWHGRYWSREAAR